MTVGPPTGALSTLEGTWHTINWYAVVPEGAEAPSAYCEGRARGMTAFYTERLKGLSGLR
jgi:hypothetical protein